MYIACYTLRQRAVRRQVDRFVISGLGHDVGPPGSMGDISSLSVMVADGWVWFRRGDKNSGPASQIEAAQGTWLAISAGPLTPGWRAAGLSHAAASPPAH